ncbi:MAG TPA: hypothetical protein VGH91_04530 [Gammaproteobacteria bacterium]|jgi:hypothetical protein
MARKQSDASDQTKRTRKPSRSKDPKKRFLVAIEDGLSITSAAKRAGMSRQYAYELKDKDPEFSRLWDESVEAATDKLEEAAFERAHDSSDQMMSFLLRARRPKKYGDKRTIDLNASVTGSLGFEDLTGLTDAQRAAKLAALFDAARARASGQAPAIGQEVAPVAGPADAGVSKPG